MHHGFGLGLGVGEEDRVGFAEVHLWSVRAFCKPCRICGREWEAYAACEKMWLGEIS